MNNTNFQDIIQFHKCFGLLYKKKPYHKIFTDDPKTVKLRLDLIEEELNELKEAIENRDMIEIGDALADILYVTYGAGASFGIDLDKAYKLVHSSNMSKLCKSEEEAKKTVEWYKNNQTVYDSPNYKVYQIEEKKYWIISIMIVF